MRIFIGLVLFLITSASFGAATAPTVKITEVPNNFGGTYTLNIGPNPTVEQWFVVAFAVTNNDAQQVSVDRSGWSATLIQESDWDIGQTFSQFGPSGEESPFFTTGTVGVGSFDNSLGLTHFQAAVYWAESYTGEFLGQNSSSSQFHWEFGPPSSTALVMLMGNGESQFLSCDLDTGGDCVASSVVPLPAAVWLFSGALGLIGWRVRAG